MAYCNYARTSVKNVSLVGIVITLSVAGSVKEN